MKQKSILVVMIALVVAAVLLVPTGYAEDDGPQGVKKYGVVHNMAPDRQVISVGGIYEPEGLDIYMKRQMDQIKAHLESLEGKLTKLEESVRLLSEDLNARRPQTTAGLVRNET